MKYLTAIYTLLLSWNILKRDTSASADPVFLVTKKECVTSKQSAIAFITHVDEVNQAVESDFFPPIDDHFKDIDCKIEESEECTRKWTSNHWHIGNSIDGPVKKIITDWRWEALPLYKTEKIDFGEKLNYEHVLTFKDGDFVIPISVRTQKEAHVYLCESNTNPHDTKCYWFMLQAFNGIKSALRKCDSGFIDEIYGQWPKAPCANNLKENKRRILSEAIWNHFRIIKDDNTLSLIKNNEELLLHFTDDKPFQVRHMFIHSKRVSGLWKIHKYSYIYSTTKDVHQLGPEIQIVKGQNCISMFIIMCSSCQMIVEIDNVYRQKFKTKDENWKEIKILLHSTKSEKYNLYVTTRSSEDTGIFWAIDHVRRCSENEYRILKLQGQEQVPCQIMENENTLDYGKLKNKETHALGTNCPENTIGEHCIPCQMFGDEVCGKFKYCESFGENTQCFCTPGYTLKNSDGVPLYIQDLTVTSKNESSISLRWKPPYPPTGTLKKYRLKYETQNAFKDWNFTKEIDPTYCKLWHNFHCATITEGIEKNWKYKIQIWATNESPLKYIRVTQNDIIVRAIVEAPESPYDMIGNWTENNDLIISWKHPNATNGLLKKFMIQLNSEKTFLKKINSEDDYNLTYTYQINHTDLEPCSKYYITVRAENRKFSSPPAQFIDWSPPPIPSYVLRRELITNSSKNIITIEIPSLENQALCKSHCRKKVYLLITESVNPEKTNNDLIRFEKSLQNQQNASVLIYSKLLLDEKQKGDTMLKQLPNPFLDRGKAYTINLIYTNECLGKYRFRRVNKTITHTGNPNLYVEDGSITKDSSSSLYALILLILLVPLLACAYKYTKRKTTTLDVISNQPQDATIIMQPPTNKRDFEIPLTDRKRAEGRIQTELSKSINVSDFELYVKESIENQELVRQHRLIRQDHTKPWGYNALKSENHSTYDYTRVNLSKLAEAEDCDYIHANYVDGYKSARAYIAAQGPKASTVDDFWRMIWTKNVKHIIMIANLYEGGKKQVEKYWPDISDIKVFNGIGVRHISTEVFTHYEYRVLEVYENDKKRKVNQLHFTSWPDHGVPLYSQSLVPFFYRILNIKFNSYSKVLVHGSANIERSGLIILCDICLRMAAVEESVDFLATLKHIRSQRANMVDSVEEYKLAHLVVLECLFGMHTFIILNASMANNIKRLLSGDGIRAQLKYLVDTEWQDHVMDTIEDVEKIPRYPEKNRFQDIVPEQHQVSLAPYPIEDKCSSYINAVQVDGYRRPGRFIVTQQPMPNTLGDFWRLVVEKESTVIISLNEINKSDQTSCQFWPINNSEIKPVDYLKITHVNSTIPHNFTITTVRVTNQRENKTTLINIISMNNWMPNDLLPNSAEEYLSLWEESDALARQSDPIIVTCFNGATASGLYIATSLIIENMKFEQQCDVCQAVRAIRRIRKQFVTSKEQFKFLYTVALMYVNDFQHYAYADTQR